MEGFYIILTGVLLVLSTTTLGCFLVLRRMAMMGDAISHAILPGLVVAFLMLQSRSEIGMLVGAGAMGILCSLIIQILHRRLKLHSDAAIGIGFTTLFAIGVILITRYTGQVDLDQECVLYGEIAYVPLELWITPSGTSLGPKALYVLGGCAAFVLGTIFIGYRGFLLTTFDPEYAHQIGLRTQGWHYGLMSLVSLTVVAAFEVVGVILVVAFLVVPAATAYLLSTRLPIMLALACVLGSIAVMAGYGMAVYVKGSIAAAMALASGFIFLIVLLYKHFLAKSDPLWTQQKIV